MVSANKIQANQATQQVCPEMVCRTMNVLSGKWGIQIVTFLMNNGKSRFMEVQRGVGGISSKILSANLQELENNKIVVRTVHNDKLTKVEYQLSESGQALHIVLSSLARWGAEHLKIINTEELSICF